MQNKDFYLSVYEIVAKIPVGKVTSYGAIAKALGIGMSARMVGFALNAAKDRTDLPCHRVVNRLGELTGKLAFPYPTFMRELLEQEGISFVGEAVDMKKHFWDDFSIPEE